MYKFPFSYSHKINAFKEKLNMKHLLFFMVSAFSIKRKLHLRHAKGVWIYKL